MKNIFLLLTCLCCLQACKDDDKDMNWTPDALTVSCNETLTEAGSGNWKVTLPTEYKGAVKLDIQTDKAWEVAVSYMTAEEEKWITPSVNGGEGSVTLTLAIADNVTAKDRKASIVITTKGDIPVKKTITIIQGNVDDVLTIGMVDKEQLPSDLIVTKNADGSLGLTLSKGFTGELNVVTYSGYATSPVMEISYPNEDQADWITFTEATTLRSTPSNTRTLSLTISENINNVYREAVVNLIATAGELTVERKIKIAQYGVEKIIWNEEYCQQEREIVVSSAAYEKIQVAAYENINPKDIELSGGNAWLTLSHEEGKVYAKVLVNESTNKERTAEIKIKNTISNTEEKMSFRQSMHGYGIVLGKKYWDLTCSTNITQQHLKSEVMRIMDNIWSNEVSGSKHVEFNKGGGDANPYIMTFDLGENPHEYNSFGIMPRLQWTNPAPSTVKIEVSDDSSQWQTVIEKKKNNGFTEEELKGASGSYNNHYEGIIHWFEFGKLQKRYIRLTVYETLTGLTGSGTYVFCLDEVFVSDRSNVNK